MYEIILYKDENEKVLYETENVEEAINIVKNYARSNHLKPYKTEVKNCIMLYNKFKNCKIVEAVGIINN